MSSMVGTLIFAWNKVKKTPQDGDLKLLADSIRSKFPLCLQFFAYEDDESLFERCQCQTN